MDLSPIETALIELLRAMGETPLHLGFTSSGEGVAVTIVEGATHAAGWGPTAEAAFSNVYTIPEPAAAPAPEPEPKPSPFRVVGGTDRAPSRSAP